MKRITPLSIKAIDCKNKTIRLRAWAVNEDRSLQQMCWRIPYIKTRGISYLKDISISDLSFTLRDIIERPLDQFLFYDDSKKFYESGFGIQLSYDEWDNEFVFLPIGKTEVSTLALRLLKYATGAMGLGWYAKWN